MSRVSWRHRALGGLCVALLGAPTLAAGADEPTIRLLWDEGHHNVHRRDGPGRSLDALFRAHQIEVESSPALLTADQLAGFDVLLISTPRGAARGTRLAEREKAAFSGAEIETLEHWVRGGGGLLLITDHRPIGGATATLARQFGVEGSNAFTEDPTQGSATDSAPDWAHDGRDIVFLRDQGSLVDHPVTRGRTPDQRVDRVATFLGQSLTGPAHSRSFLVLQSQAVDRHRVWKVDHWQETSPGDRRASAAGRSQGLALDHGQGRVVILGEAGMFGPRGLDPATVDPSGQPLDNRRLALNIVRWLAGRE